MVKIDYEDIEYFGLSSKVRYVYNQNNFDIFN